MTVTCVSHERKASNKILRRWCADVTGDVLSIGSGGDIDKEGGKYRDYFVNAKSYTTSDIDPSLHCDLVLDVRSDLGFHKYDAIFCSGVLEHVDDLDAAMDKIDSALRFNGVLIVGVPFKQPVHRAPRDFWRFTEFGLRKLLGAFRIDDLVHVGDVEHPIAYWAKAVKA